MTQEKIVKSFNGSAKTILEIIRLWLPLTLGMLSLLISSYSYRLKAELKDEIKNAYVSKEEFSFTKEKIDKNSKIVDQIPITYVNKTDWNSAILPLQDRANKNDVNQAKLEQIIKNLETVLSDFKSELGDFKKHVRNEK